MKDPEVLNIAGDTFTMLISAAEIQEKTAQLAQVIKTDMGEDDIPLFVCVLKGGFIFASDLIRYYDGLCEIDFIRVSSYAGTESTGKIKTFPGMDFDKVKGRRVIIVEDIIDTGLSMSFLKEELLKHGPKSFSIASLFVKPSRCVHTVKVDYKCFDIPDKFIVGYGLDCDEMFRNLPAIYVKEQ